MYQLIRSLLFLLDGECAHTLTLKTIKCLHALHLSFLFKQSIPQKPVSCMGITFPNPVGLSAGIDRDAEYADALAELGAGFIELGGVTPIAQAGNPKPRLFRLKEHRALINRMGFYGCGLERFVKNIKNIKSDIIKGVNIAKNKATPLENAVDDYLVCVHALYPFVDYITINVSSPNTPGLRDLQQGDYMRSMLTTLKAAQASLENEHGKHVPFVIKLSPDLTEAEVEEIAPILVETKIEGLIVGNTSLSREGVERHSVSKEQGGLSGAPIAERTTKLLAHFNRLLGGKVTLIGMGGIMDVDSAQEKFNNGANLVQVYTGLIYKGPSLIKEIVEGVNNENNR